MMGIAPTTEDKQDLLRAVICFLVIIVCSILVGFGKIDVNVFILIISNITSFYLGKTSNKGSVIG